MNVHFNAFVEHAKSIASERLIKWDVKLDDEGFAVSEDVWNLTEIVGGSPPPSHLIRDFGMDDKALDYINKVRLNHSESLLYRTPLTPAWQDFIKAAIIYQLLVKKNTTAHIVSGVARPLRVIATCVNGKEPWELLADDITATHEIAIQIQASGQLAHIILGCVKTIFDINHIFDVGQLYPILSIPRSYVRSKRAKSTKSVEELLNNLEERKNSEKLPEKRALWELIRIVFTEQPKSFLDFLRFSQVKIMLICGLRIGEVCLLPSDWKRVKEYYDHTGKSASDLGGYSHSLLLRHFAEKQQSSKSNSLELYENVQFIPEMFEKILTDTLDKVTLATKPLRETLQRQIEEKRLLPHFKLNELVPVISIYPYLTGNPFFLNIDEVSKGIYKSRYRSNYDPSIFDEIFHFQLDNQSELRMDDSTYMQYNRMKGKIPFRDKAGNRFRDDTRLRWSEVYFRIEELETYLGQHAKTKLSDDTPFKLTSGQCLQPWELLFLMPKRALSEGRNDGLCDITRYFSIGRMDSSMLQYSLGGKNNSGESLFESYSQTEQDRKLSIKSHSLRHLQNTELFRLGVDDTIISKHYNRRSVQQSYEYDHRSLSEELAAIQLPDDVEIFLGDKPSTVLRLIKSGKASGPIVQSFKKIQLEQGEDAALEYLSAEADGFHSTPYGHCINSFTVDPCPKNLECFAGCNHLTATNLPENRQNLIKLEGRVSAALNAVQARPSKTIGRDNQIAHAKSRLEGIHKLLSTPDGEKVFPNGIDLSKPNEGSVFDGI